MSFLSLHGDYTKRDAQHVSRFLVAEIDGYYEVTTEAGDLALRLRIRQAYPKTFCVVGETVSFGYGSVGEGAEYLICTLYPDGKITIMRDEYVALPLFYSFSQGQFELSNVYEDIVEQTAVKTINHRHVVNLLRPNPDYHDTLYHEIKILDERMVLDIDSNGAIITKPVNRSWQVTADAAAIDPKDFQRVLSRHLDTFIATRLEGNNVAFEVSAGIDSSLLPLYYKSKKATAITTGTMVFPGEYKQSQLAKRDLIQSGESAISIPVDPKNDYPLSRFIKGTVRPFYSFEEIYAEPLEKLAAALARRGIEVVSTGIGGDELFENNVVLEDEFRFGQSTMTARAETTLPSYFTDTFQKKWTSATPAEMPYAVPLLGMSLHGAQLARNAIYIAHDIWPVSPFADSKLYEFCQGLPVIFRSNKNILRAYYDAHSFPAEISNPAVNENFGRFFDDCLSSGIYDHIVAMYAGQSVVEQWGYIDAKALLNRWQQKGDLLTDPLTKRLLFSVFTWLSLEMNIAASKRI
ncbi:hypothetical protein H7200_01060 [Candidatus Saccharibacteria bacterium]|nr:hypothetical protein [Candidatus Saccharibacteria bacterium]